MSTEVGVIVAMLVIFVVLAVVMTWRRGGPRSGEPPAERSVRQNLDLLIVVGCMLLALVMVLTVPR
jgi:putative copper export protein